MSMMEIRGIKTNNLKDISVTIPKNKITAIYGKSGAGKTSLAFDSIYRLCKSEFDSMEDGFSDETGYIISSFENIMPAVAIVQKNTNNNPRSTLFSYLNIAQLIISENTNNDSIPHYSLLKLNKAGNECLTCNGLGETYQFDMHSMIDEKRAINEQPFDCWRNSSLSSLYIALLIGFCQQEKIDVEKSFYQLSKQEQDKILFGVSDKKLKVRFKHQGKSKQRQAYYKGVSKYIESNKKLKSVNNCMVHMVCQACQGSRVNYKKYQGIKIFGINFVDLMIKPIDYLLKHILINKEQSKLSHVLKSICDLGLGYLCLSRSIPSLSGGELQKIRFSKLLHSNISNILVVLDEISSQINFKDYEVFLEKIKKISERNTVILIEHNEKFIEFADYKIHIGEVAGKEGGYICKNNTIRPLVYDTKHHSIDNFIEFNGLNKNNIVNQNVSIPKKCLTVFRGASGSGKSSLAKAIESKSSCIYITQKVSNYTSRSVLSSTLNLSNKIAEYYSKKTGVDKPYFLPSKDGGCRSCQGIGVIKYERGYEKDLYLECTACEGKLFNSQIAETQIKVNDLSISDLYDLEIGKLGKYIDSASIRNILDALVALGLSHLQLNRKTQTLSGGELRRVKLSEHLVKTRENKNILIIDEPIAGLDPETASKVLHYIYHKTVLFSAVIVIEHREEVMLFADYEVNMGYKSGDKGGIISFQSINLRDTE